MFHKKSALIIGALVLALVSLSTSPAQAISPTNVQRFFDDNGDSSEFSTVGDIREMSVQSWTKRDSIYFYLKTNDAIAYEAFSDGSMEATISLDTNLDGIEDFWITSGLYYLENSLTPVSIYATQTGFPVAGCFANIYGDTQNRAHWVGWSLKPSCIGIEEEFGVKGFVSKDQSYGTGALPRTSDFVPNSGFVKVTNPLLQKLTKFSAPKVKGTPQVGQLLTSEVVGWDAGVGFKYQWMLDGKPVTGAIKPSYTPLASDVGKKITLAVKGSKRGFLSQTTTSSALTIQAAPLVKTPAPTLSGSVVPDGTLQIMTGLWDQGVTFTYVWKKNDQVIDGESKASYLVRPSDVGSQISVQVSGSKPGFSTKSFTTTSDVVRPNSSLKAGTVTLTGTYKVGSKLKARVSGWPAGLTLNLQWMRDGKKIPKATATSYVLTATDLGKKVSVVVTAEKPGYSSVSAKSKAKKVSKK